MFNFFGDNKKQKHFKGVAMKTIKKIITVTLCLIIYAYAVVYSVIPSTLTMIQGKELSYPFYDFIDINFSEGSNIKTVGSNLISPIIGKEEATLALFGVIPVKKIDVNVVSDSVVVSGGEAIGMKLNSSGLTIVTFEEVTTRDYSKVKPYKDKNIQRGDTIVEVNGVKVEEVNQFIKEIQKTKGAPVELSFLRNSKLYKENLTPVIDRNDGKYKLGMWVKNITSGVGTITYIDKNTGMFGALGHGISDIDGMDLLDVRDGTAYKAVILSVKKGLKGNPGELKGAIRENDVYGEVVKNTRFGVFGYIDKDADIQGEEYEICLKNDVKEGEAKILSTINGEEVREYDICIEQVNTHGEIKEKSMIIRIIDPKLIEETGGIVQGMSGSPIIQDGKLVGAVTHVLINEPTRGYGIFIENMLEEAG